MDAKLACRSAFLVRIPNQISMQCSFARLNPLVRMCALKSLNARLFVSANRLGSLGKTLRSILINSADPGSIRVKYGFVICGPCLIRIIRVIRGYPCWHSSFTAKNNTVQPRITQITRITAKQQIDSMLFQIGGVHPKVELQSV
jgi:hypothetical protein